MCLYSLIYTALLIYPNLNRKVKAKLQTLQNKCNVHISAFN